MGLFVHKIFIFNSTTKSAEFMGFYKLNCSDEAIIFSPPVLLRRGRERADGWVRGCWPRPISLRPAGLRLEWKKKKENSAYDA